MAGTRRIGTRRVSSGRTPSAWVATLHRQGRVFDIGQLGPDQIKALDKEVKAGRATKTKAIWPFITHGTVRKTVWLTGAHR